MNFLRRKSKFPSFARSQSASDLLLSESPLHQERKEEGGDCSNDGESEDFRKHLFSIGEHNYSDVSDREGWILVPNRLPEDWSDAVDMKASRSLDRSFIFSGEQLHILACLTSSKQDRDITSSFIDSEEIPINSRSIEINKEKMTSGNTQTNSICGIVDINSEQQDVSSDMTTSKGSNISTKEEFSTDGSLVQLEEDKSQTSEFKNSDFFVRISESGEPLWSKISKIEAAQASDDISRKSLRENLSNTNIDSGTFTSAFCGLARNAAKCYSLRNGDIAVFLQVNVGIDNIKDPVLEVLQFVKSKTSHLSSQYSQSLNSCHDPNRELLRWVVPLDNASKPIPQVSPKSSSVGFVPDSGSGHLRSPLSIPSSSSQLFSFGNFKTYSMSSLPPTLSLSVSSHLRPSFDLEGLDHVSFEKLINNQFLEMRMPLSFRGVFLEPEKFSIQCGLGGVYLPGRRWRKKLEIIQPIEMHSFAADCNTENLLCVQIKNISPSHIPEMIIYLDAINIIFEEAPMYGPPLFLPLSCIDAGCDHSLPNLALRRGEEHSFILKPNQHYSNIKEGASNLSIGNSVFNLTKYAILVSYKCNYAESKLFFKKPTSWRPRAARDLMLSVESVVSEQKDELERSSQLPFQVLTLQASNLTSEDLTLLILAPASFTTPSSVSLDSVPRISVERVSTISEGGPTLNDPMLLPGAKKEIINLVMGSFFVDDDVTQSSIPNCDSNYTHLWLQSTVSLGNHTRCVRAQSNVTFKLQSLSLTCGIITLDTLQILVKEKGVTYVPERPLKIYPSSSIAVKI